MPYSSSVRAVKQTPGTNTNVWGDVENAGLVDVFDAAIAGWTAIALTGNYSLTTANGAADEARSAMLKFTGAGPFSVTVPSVSKAYIVWNACSAATTVTTGAGASVTLQSGEWATIACNGSGVYKAQPTDFGSQRITNVGSPTASTDAATKGYADNLAFTANAGILPGQTGSAGYYLTSDGNVTASWAPFYATPAQIWAGSSITTAFTPGKYKDSLAPLALGDSANITPDLSASKRFTLTKGTNGTLSLPIHTFPGDIFEIYITQDGTGSRTMSYATGYRRPSGAVPLSTAAAARDKFIGVVEAVDGSGTATDVTYNLLRNLTA